MDEYVNARWISSAPAGSQTKLIPRNDGKMRSFLWRWMLEKINCNNADEFAAEMMSGFLVGLWRNGMLTAGVLITVMGILFSFLDSMGTLMGLGLYTV